MLAAATAVDTSQRTSLPPRVAEIALNYDQGGAAARRRGPAIAPGLRPWGGPGRARAGPHALSPPLIYWAHPGTQP